MAKLKPLKDDKELSAIPIDEPVLVELEPMATGAADDADDPSERIDGVTRTKEDTGVNVLREQLEAAQRATEASNKRAAEAERRAEQAERERHEARTSQSATEADAVQSGLAAAQSEQNAAKQALKQAGESGDWEAMAEANARIGRAASDIREFERAAATLAERKPEPRQEPQRPVDVMAAIDSNTNLYDAEKTWLKKHPEAFGIRNKEVEVAYGRAMDKGLRRGSAEYFDFMDDFMGYAKPRTDDDGEATVSAPVSRDNRSSATGQRTGNQIMLSPEQRALAQTMGVSDVQYAQGVARLNKEKREQPEKFGIGRGA